MKNSSNQSHSVASNNADNIVLHELVKIIYYQPIYTIMTGHALAVIITVAFLWNTVPTHWLLSWAIILIVQTLATLLGQQSHSPPDCFSACSLASMA